MSEEDFFSFVRSILMLTTVRPPDSGACGSRQSGHSEWREARDRGSGRRSGRREKSQAESETAVTGDDGGCRNSRSCSLSTLTLTTPAARCHSLSH